MWSNKEQNGRNQIPKNPPSNDRRRSIRSGTCFTKHSYVHSSNFGHWFHVRREPMNIHPDLHINAYTQLWLLLDYFYDYFLDYMRWRCTYCRAIMDQSSSRTQVLCYHPILKGYKHFILGFALLMSSHSSWAKVCTTHTHCNYTILEEYFVLLRDWVCHFSRLKKQSKPVAWMLLRWEWDIMRFFYTNAGE